MSHITSVTTLGARTTKFDYDENYNVTGLTDPKGYLYQKQYDKDNRMIGTVDPLAQTEKVTYDPGSRITKIQDKMGLFQSFAYDAHGNVTSRTATNGMVTRFSYDLLDNLLSVTDPMNNVTRYHYDSMGNITSMTDAKLNVTEYTYDLENNMTSLKTPMGRTEQYTYDVAGRLSSKLTPKGDTIHYDYDKLNGLAEKTYEDSDGNEADRPVQFVYNAMGQRITMEDITGESSYTYDSLERLQTATNGSGKVVEYYYDEANNLQEILYPDGYAVLYEYDLNDNITKIIDRDNRETTYEYDPINRVTKTVRADGGYSEFLYNARNQITKVENFCECGFSISKYEYTYDDAGLIVSEKAVECLETSNKDYTHTGGSNDQCAHKQDNPWMNQNPQHQTTSRTFEYDNNGQLLKCVENKRQEDGQFWKYTYTYEYDTVGNRTKAKKQDNVSFKNPDVTTYEYNADNQMVSAMVCESNTTKPYKFTYDANGNLTKECFHTWPEVTYQYDTENRLKAVSSTQELLMAAVYDGDGNRAFQLNYNTGAVCGYGKNMSGEVYIPAHNKNEDGSLTAEGELFSYICSETGRSYDLIEYVNDTTQEYTQVLEAYTINSGATEAYTYGNGRVSRNNYWIEARDVTHNEMSYYLYDGRGSVTGNTWYNGMVTDVYQYDPYGKVTLGSTEHTEFYGYNAESYNPNTGLEYLRARYYNPNKGRFFQEDSYLGNIADPLTLNRYAYTKNSPLNYVDPSGHSSKSLVSNLTNLRESVMTKLLHSMETQSTVEIIPGILSISMQEAMDASEVTDCFLEETASEIIGFIEEMSYYMGYLGVGLALPPLWKGWNSLLEDKVEGPIVNQILNAEYYYSGKAQADLFIAALGKSLDNILWNTVTDLGLILGAIGNGGGPLAGALSGGGISVSAGAVVVTVGEAALIGIIGGVAVAGGSQILQSEGKSNAGKNQEKADNAAKEGADSVKPEAAVTGSKKHGVNWKEGPARAKATGIPQGQWAKSDLDYATEMANTLKPGESGYFDLPEGSQSIVHMKNGTTQSATRMWIRNNGTGTWHGYPML